jgi:4-amino-4-deoxy-L-arabinose transferase-like glycosyltransferase
MRFVRMKSRPPIASPIPERILLFAICVAGLIVRLWGISSYQYNGDEMQFVLIARGRTLGEVWRRGLAELHPPLANFLHHYLLMVGPDVFIQRLFTVALGMAAIIGIYCYATVLKTPCLGLVCAFFMAVAPVAVSTSIVFRNYALFMALLSFALYCFARFSRYGKPADLAAYITLILLACATHFSGFIVAAACGLQLGGNFLYHRKWRAFFIFCLSHLPILAFAGVTYIFYLAPGSIGPVWKKLFLDTGFIPRSSAETAQRLLVGILAYAVPLRNFLSHSWQMRRSVQVVMLVSTLVTLFFQIAGLRQIYRHSKDTCILICCVWGVAIILALFNIYSFDDTRHNYYLLPFFVLPFAYLLEPIARALTESSRRVIPAAAGLLVTAAALAASGCYLNYDSEFVLTRKQLADGQRFLNTHLHPGDIIVTGRIDAYFYLLYAKDNGTTPYDAYTEVSYLRDTILLAPYNATFIPYTDHLFRDSLVADAARRHLSPPGKYWFVAYGWKNTEILDLLQCDALKGQIGDFYSTDGALIFSVRAPVLWDLLRNSDAWNRGYAAYAPMIYAVPLEKVSAPQ